MTAIKLRRNEKLLPSFEPLFDDLMDCPTGRMPNTYRSVIVDGIKIYIREDVYDDTVAKYRAAKRLVVEAKTRR